MPSSAPFIDAEKRHAASIGVPGTLIIDGVNHPARIYTEQGQRFVMEGGSLQQRKLNAVVLCSVLPRTRILDDNGDTRSILLTHRETGIDYRLTPGGVNQSPHGVFWLLTCTQPTAK